VSSRLVPDELYGERPLSYGTLCLLLASGMRLRTGHAMLGSKRQRALLARVVAGLLGSALVAIGLLHIVAGQPHYRNYWGGLVFAPFAILLGGFLIYFGLGRSDALVVSFAQGRKRLRK
jgi:hypothetical protein